MSTDPAPDTATGADADAASGSTDTMTSGNPNACSPEGTHRLNRCWVVGRGTAYGLWRSPPPRSSRPG
jgi:hypothetical protein